MPIITITMRKTTPETKRQLIEKITAAAVQITRIPDHHFVCSINELDDTNLGIGGKSVEDILKAS
jgi:4-oxalocrotonate tautomerase